MIPYDELSERAIPWHTSFVGQYMQHNYWVYAIIDRVLMANPTIRSIIEIGTGSGALTSVFGLWGVKRNHPVLTIDKEMRHDRTILDKLGVKYLQADEFSQEAQAAIINTVNRMPTLLYCDGGCKSKEIQHYARYIPKGSIIAVHDLGAEFNHEIDAEAMVPFLIEPYQESWWMEANVQLALYRRT